VSDTEFSVHSTLWGSTALDTLVTSQPPLPETLYPTPYTLNPTPCTLRPACYTLHPAPCTLYPTPCTLHPTPYILHPTPYTLHPTPKTQNPTPCTLHPAPFTVYPTHHTLNLTTGSCPIAPWTRRRPRAPRLGYRGTSTIRNVLHKDQSVLGVSRFLIIKKRTPSVLGDFSDFRAKSLKFSDFRAKSSDFRAKLRKGHRAFSLSFFIGPP